LKPDTSEQPTAAIVRAFACRLLGRREYAVHELEQRLLQKWPALDAALLAHLLAALIDENLLSDERFVESFVRSNLQRSQGPLKIRAALRARGIPDALVSAGLEQPETDWTDLATRWLERQHPGPLDFSARARYYRRLLNRGFTHDQAMDALNALAGDA